MLITALGKVMLLYHVLHKISSEREKGTVSIFQLEKSSET